MTAKTPTATGISILLRKAGFTRYQTGRLGSSSGFVVSKDRIRPGASVRVRHHFASPVVELDAGQHREKLSRYAKTITEAGWTVEAGTYELIVTAKRPEPVVTTTMFTPAEQAAWEVAVERGLAITAADLRAMLTAASLLAAKDGD